MKHSDSAQILRNRVKSALDERGWGGRRALAQAMGLKGQSAITQWLNGEHNPSADKLDGIAAFLGCSVADLFTSEKSCAVTRPVKGTGVDSGSPTQGGVTTNESTVAALRAENATLRQLLKRISAEVDILRACGDALADLAAVEKAPGRLSKTGGRKSGPRGGAA